jgi:hypothetical protein
MYVPCGDFSSFSKTLGDWLNVKPTLGALGTVSGLSHVRDQFARIPQDCFLSNVRAHLNGFSGLDVAFVSGTHRLRADELESAFDLIAPNTRRAYTKFVLNKRHLSYRSEQLFEPGVVAGYAGWKLDVEVPNGAYFFQVRIDCKPHGSKADYLAACWRDIIRHVGLEREMSTEMDGESWVVYPLGTFRLRTTVGPLQPKGDARCRDAWGIEVTGFNDLTSARSLLQRFGSIGDSLEEIFTCQIPGRDYAATYQEFDALRPGWDANISALFLPEDKKALLEGREPNAAEVPGARFSWESRSLEARASLGFNRIDGQWHAVIGAFCNALEAQEEFSRLLAGQGYARTY